MGKLVRDNIPKIIRKDGGRPRTRILSAAKYKRALLDKLVEEAEELRTAKRESDQILEMADILEVVKAIHHEFRWPHHYTEEMRSRRKQQRGGFTKRIYLIKTAG